MNSTATNNLPEGLDQHLSEDETEQLRDDVDWDELKDTLESLTEENQFLVARWLIADDFEKFRVEREIAEQEKRTDSEPVKAATCPEVLYPAWQGDAYLQTLLEEVSQMEPEPDPWRDLSKRQQAFLLNFLHFGSILKASQGVCHIASPYAWQEACPEYAKAFEQVIRLRDDELLCRAQTLAMHGERVPSLNKNGLPITSFAEQKQIYLTRKSDRMLIYLVNRRDRLRTTEQANPLSPMVRSGRGGRG